MAKSIQIEEKNGIPEVSDIQERNLLLKDGNKSPDKTLPSVILAEVGEFAPNFQIDWYFCDGCGLCAEVCPEDLIVIQNFKAMIPPEKYVHCYECGSCMSVCMKDAIFRV